MNELTKTPRPGVIHDGQIGYLVCGDVDDRETLGFCIYRVRVRYQMTADGALIKWYEDAHNEECPEVYTDGVEDMYEQHKLFTQIHRE